MQPDRAYYPALTGARAITAYCVFYYHFPLIRRGVMGDWFDRLTGELHVGVIIFYVLSGFLIWHRYGGQIGGFSRAWVGRYAQNRFARIWPIYALLLLFTYARAGFPDLRTLLATFTLTQSFFPDLTHAGIAQAWTLTIEETFYFSASLIFLATRRFGLLVSCLAVLAIGPLIVAFDVPFNPLAGNVSQVLGRTLCGTIFCFGAGMQLARIIARRQADGLQTSASGWWTYGGLALTIGVLTLVSQLSRWVDPTTVVRGVPHGVDHPLGALMLFTVFPAAVACMLFGLITERTLIARLLSTPFFLLLGNSSYCFYLAHKGELQQMVFEWISIDHTVLFFVINLLAIGLYLLIERPLHEWLRAGTSPEPAPSPSALAPAMRLSTAWLAIAWLGGLLAIAVPWWLRTTDQLPTHNWLLAEDGPYESAQAVIAALTAVTFLHAFWISGRTFAPRNPWLAVGGILFVLMAGEELSWGQRLVGFQTPTWLRASNYQGETTLHNLTWFQTSGEGNALQILWLVAVLIGVGLLPLTARTLPRLHVLLLNYRIPLVSCGIAALVLAIFATYALAKVSSEALELAVAIMLLATALEIHRNQPAEARERSRRQWHGELAAVGGLLVAILPLQAGELSLPSMQSGQATNMARAELAAGNPARAQELFETALRIWPRNLPATMDLAQLHMSRGEVADTIAVYRSALTHDPTAWQAANNMAWLLSTVDDDALRNGKEALTWAQAIIDRGGFRHPSNFDTLAAAYAACGDFKQAEATANTAEQNARLEGNTELAERIARRRDGYRSGLAVREPVASRATEGPKP